DFMGAGWSWNYGSTITASDCGLVNVSTPDGSGQVFRTTDGGQTFTPQRGYHTRLNRLSDGSYEFIEKSGNRYYFREPLDPHRLDGPVRLDRIVEPHGDKIEVDYDLYGRVSRVREVLKGERPVRSLSVRYERHGGYDRIASVRSSLGHEVTYDYDSEGNLT